MGRPALYPHALCHPDKKHHSKGLCEVCYRAKYRKEYRLELNEYDKARSHRYGSPAYMLQAFKSRIKRKYNIAYEYFLNLLTTQNNLCFLCKKPPKEGKSLHIDHNHSTMKVRGLLCATCNWFLGKIDKDPTMLERLNEYVKR